MVYHIIWADRVALRDVKACMGYEEMYIITIKKTDKKSTNRR